MTTIQTNITGRPPRVHRGRQKVKPTSAEAFVGLDHVLIPPAGQLRLSSPYHPRKEHTDHERDAQRNAGYQKGSRDRKANRRISIFTGKKVKDPVSIVPLRLSRFEKKQVIEASSSEVLVKLGYDTRRTLTPREDRDFYAALARELLVELLGERLSPKK
jgi:hypothetical protein